MKDMQVERCTCVAEMQVGGRRRRRKLGRNVIGELHLTGEDMQRKGRSKKELRMKYLMGVRKTERK